MFVSPGDVAFRIFSVPIYYYGLTMALSLLSGILISNFICKKFYPELNPEMIYDISPYLIISAIIGARLYYCLMNLNYYASNPLQILDIRQGGLSIHGALIFGLAAGIIYAKKHNLPILKLCDIFSYGLILGQSIGRWGNFFNSEAFGYPTNIFLKLYIPIHNRPIQFMQYEYFHPTFLYESILDFFTFLILYFVIRKIAKGKDGIIFFSYLILYSIVRFFIEGLRIDSVLDIQGIPIAQIVSVLIIIFSIICLIRITRKKC